MKINLSKYAGFCDGVKRAFDMAMNLDLEKIKNPVFVLGTLVHNPEVNKKIEKKGIKEIGEKEFFDAKPGEIGTIIITAHGTGPDIYKMAEEKNMTVFDTTCPKVTKVQTLARVWAKRGYRIMIVGDRDHKEVKGISGWGGGKAIIISEEKDLGNLNFDENEKIAILSQTTQNEEFFKKIGEQIKEKYKKAEIMNTTCNATHERQKEAKKMAGENDVMVIVGSVTSANSKRLFEISKNINPLSYFIEKAENLEKKWFEGAKSVGLTAGASTPGWIIEEVAEKIRKS